MLGFRPRRLLAATLAALLAVGPAPGAAQTLPELGDASQVKLSSLQEKKLGDAIMRQARATSAVLDDPEVNDYLNQLGARLVAAIPGTSGEFEFFAVPETTINAFALPGGYIGVNAGLILMTQSESELASVLAHEITHVTQHHTARQIEGQQNSLLMSLATLAVALLAARAGGSSSGEMAQAAVASSQALLMQSQLNYTREFEFEADRIGFQRLDAAGFDVSAASSVMDRMQRQIRFVEGNAPSYLRTHPLGIERVAEAQARADRVAYRQVADSLDFHLVRALLRSYQGQPRDAVAYFEGALAERKYNSELATHYGLVASLLRSKDYTRAKAEMAKVDAKAPPHPMIEAMGAHVLLESGDIAAAVNRIEGALQRYPNKMQLVYDYPEALLRAKRPADAALFVEEQLKRFPGNGKLHRLGARAYADLDRKLKQHYHQGEYYAWLGNLKGAIDQMQIASRAGDGNFYDASVVDTRMRTLRQEMAEQEKEGFGRNG